jgi:RNA:NAD 2'-phosphotransferase (TPT1/KptA family)
MNNRNTSFTKSPVTPRTIYRSHFPSEAQYLDAERLIKSLMGYKIQAERDKEGRVMIDEVLDVLVREDQNLGFVDFEHLSEIFLRHNPVMFYIQGEYLVPSRPATAGLHIDPPDTLYFGTISSVSSLAQQKGLMSLHNSHVIVTSDREIAVKRAKEFSEKTANSYPSLVIVDAKAAKSAGTIFLGGDKSHLYKSEHISRTYISVEDV